MGSFQGENGERSARPDARREAGREFLDLIGVVPIAPATVPFDPGYDTATVCAHLEQSAHVMRMLKLSMATWLVADKAATSAKIAAARAHGVPVVTGGGPFEIAAALHALPEYLDLCAAFGFTRIEAGEGFTELRESPDRIVAMAVERGLEVQFELGKKHDGPFVGSQRRALVERGREWLDAGAREIIVEARESANAVGLFDATGALNASMAETFVEAFGFEYVVFEAPTKPSQFAFIDHFGPSVGLTNVRLEELLRVEIYRRGLHSDAYEKPNLRPRRQHAHDTSRGE